MDSTSENPSQPWEQQSDKPHRDYALFERYRSSKLLGSAISVLTFADWVLFSRN